MLQENQESDEPPRQSASFKVLQEILETGTLRDIGSVKGASGQGLYTMTFIWTE